MSEATTLPSEPHPLLKKRVFVWVKEEIIVKEIFSLVGNSQSGKIGIFRPMAQRFGGALTAAWPDWAFFKVIGYKFVWKCNPNICWLLGLFWKMLLFSKNFGGHFLWATFRKFGQLFIATSGHTGPTKAQTDVKTNKFCTKQIDRQKKVLMWVEKEVVRCFR